MKWIILLSLQANATPTFVLPKKRHGRSCSERFGVRRRQEDHTFPIFCLSMLHQRVQLCCHSSHPSSAPCLWAWSSPSMLPFVCFSQQGTPCSHADLSSPFAVSFFLCKLHFLKVLSSHLNNERRNLFLTDSWTFEHFLKFTSPLSCQSIFSVKIYIS